MALNVHTNEISALEALFRRFYKPLRAYAYKFTEDMDVAEDIVQDVFFELWSHKDSLSFTDSLKSYLFTSVYNRSLNLINYRSHKKQQSLEPNDESRITQSYMHTNLLNQEQELLIKELENEITLYIESLPAQCKKIFILSRTKGLKNREIADLLGISIKAVEKQISKALHGLKKNLSEKDLLLLLLFLKINNHL